MIPLSSQPLKSRARLRAHSEHTARETAHCFFPALTSDGVPAQRRPPTACHTRRHPRGRVSRRGGAWPLPRPLPAAPHLGVGSRGRWRRGGACAALAAALALPAIGWAPPVGATVTSFASSVASSVVAASVARSRCVPPCPHASGTLEVPLPSSRPRLLLLSHTLLTPAPPTSLHTTPLLTMSGLEPCRWPTSSS